MHDSWFMFHDLGLLTSPSEIVSFWLKYVKFILNKMVLFQTNREGSCMNIIRGQI